jgi:hypothetical protein
VTPKAPPTPAPIPDEIPTVPALPSEALDDMAKDH